MPFPHFARDVEIRPFEHRLSTDRRSAVLGVVAELKKVGLGKFEHAFALVRSARPSEFKSSTCVRGGFRPRTALSVLDWSPHWSWVSSLVTLLLLSRDDVEAETAGSAIKRADQHSPSDRQHVGRVLAVWTSATGAATSSHCAPTVCMTAPMLLMRTASQIERKAGWRWGAHAECTSAPGSATCTGGGGSTLPSVAREPEAVLIILKLLSLSMCALPFLRSAVRPLLHLSRVPGALNGDPRGSSLDFTQIVGREFNVYSADVLLQTFQFPGARDRNNLRFLGE